MMSTLQQEIDAIYPHLDAEIDKVLTGFADDKKLSLSSFETIEANLALYLAKLNSDDVISQLNELFTQLAKLMQEIKGKIKSYDSYSENLTPIEIIEHSERLKKDEQQVLTENKEALLGLVKRLKDALLSSASLENEPSSPLENSNAARAQLNLESSPQANLRLTAYRDLSVILNSAENNFSLSKIYKTIQLIYDNLQKINACDDNIHEQYQRFFRLKNLAEQANNTNQSIDEIAEKDISLKLYQQDKVISGSLDVISKFLDDIFFELNINATSKPLTWSAQDFNSILLPVKQVIEKVQEAITEINSKELNKTENKPDLFDLSRINLLAEKFQKLDEQIRRKVAQQVTFKNKLAEHHKNLITQNSAFKSTLSSLEELEEEINIYFSATSSYKLDRAKLVHYQNKITELNNLKQIQETATYNHQVMQKLGEESQLNEFSDNYKDDLLRLKRDTAKLIQLTAEADNKVAQLCRLIEEKIKLADISIASLSNFTSEVTSPVNKASTEIKNNSPNHPQLKGLHELASEIESALQAAETQAINLQQWELDISAIISKQPFADEHYKTLKKYESWVRKISDSAMSQFQQISSKCNRFISNHYLENNSKTPAKLAKKLQDLEKLNKKVTQQAEQLVGQIAHKISTIDKAKSSKAIATDGQASQTADKQTVTIKPADQPVCNPWKTIRPYLEQHWVNPQNLVKRAGDYLKANTTEWWGNPKDSASVVYVNVNRTSTVYYRALKLLRAVDGKQFEIPVTDKAELPGELKKDQAVVIDFNAADEKTQLNKFAKLLAKPRVEITEQTISCLNTRYASDQDLQEIAHIIKAGYGKFAPVNLTIPVAMQDDYAEIARLVSKISTQKNPIKKILLATHDGKTPTKECNEEYYKKIMGCLTLNLKPSDILEAEKTFRYFPEKMQALLKAAVIQQKENVLPDNRRVSTALDASNNSQSSVSPLLAN